MFNNSKLYLGSSESAFLRMAVTLHIYLNILKIKMLKMAGASGKQEINFQNLL